MSYNSIQFNSILTLSALSQHRPHRVRAQSHKTVPLALPQPQMSVISPSIVTCTSDKPAINHGFPWPLIRFTFCQNGSQNSGKYCTYYYEFIIKDTTQEQPSGRDAQGERCWKVSELLYLPQVHHLPSTSIFSSTWKIISYFSPAKPCPSPKQTIFPFLST